MMSAAETQPASHPFSVFGPGPYTFVGLETTDDRQAANAAAMNSGLTYTTNMCGGSCDLCGHEIWNVFTFKTATGRKFKVGCDCAEKAGEGHQVREGKRLHAAGLRADARREYMETECRSRDARLEAERDYNESLGHGRLTNDELVAKIEADREAEKQARRDASRHIGKPGERIKNVLLRYEGIYSYESAYGWQHLVFLRTVEGHNAIVWKTSTGRPRKIVRQGDHEFSEAVEEGETFVASFTVKSHGSYQREEAPRAELQTKVERLTVAKPKPEKPAEREKRLADEAARKDAERRAWKREVIQSKIDLATPSADRDRERLAELTAALVVPGIKDSTREALESVIETYRDGLARQDAEIATLRAELEAVG